MSVHDFGVGVAVAVSDPGAIAGSEHRFERCDQAARGNDYLERLAISPVHVGLAVRDDKQVAVFQTSAELHRETIRRPQGFSRVAQTRLIFGSAAGVVEALRHGGNFASQGPEHVEIRHFLVERNLPRAECPHPERCSCDRAGNAPTDNQQRKQDDEEDLSQHTKE